jgi:hypothetical protein
MSVSWHSHCLGEAGRDPISIHKHLKCEKTRRNGNFLSWYQMYFWHFREGTESKKQFQLIPPKKIFQFQLSAFLLGVSINSILCTNLFPVILDFSKKYFVCITLSIWNASFRVESLFQKFPGSRNFSPNWKLGLTKNHIFYLHSLVCKYWLKGEKEKTLYGQDKRPAGPIQLWAQKVFVSLATIFKLLYLDICRSETVASL